MEKVEVKGHLKELKKHSTMILLLDTFMRHIARIASYTLIISGLIITGFSLPSETLYYTKAFAQEPPVVEEIACTGQFCSCVIYLRENKGLPVSGNAVDFQPNYFGVPHRGDIAIFKYSNGTSHVGFVEYPFPSGNFYVSEANFKPGEYSERVVMLDDPFLVGFIHKIR